MKKLMAVVVLIITFFAFFAVGSFAASEMESNNNAKTATVIPVNTTVTGNLSSSNDLDWFKITIPKDGVISVDFKHENLFDDQFYWAISLFHSDAVTHISEGNTVYVVRGNRDRVLPEFGVPAGTYYICIEDWDKHSACNYEFQVTYSANDYYEKESNNTAKNATPVILNAKYSGSITQKDDADWYKLEIPQEGQFSVVFENENLFDDQYYWIIELFHYDGTSKIATTDNRRYGVSGNDESEVFAEFGVLPGTYFMKITAYEEVEYSTSTYRFSVRFKENPYCEKESNNAVKNATPIKMMQKYSGAINFSDDVDWYKVVIEKDMVVSVFFEHPLLQSDSDYWYVEWFKSNGTSHVNDDNVSYFIKGNENRVLPDIRLSAGTYYIKIYPGETSLDTYSFSVTEKHDCKGNFIIVKNPTCTEPGTKKMNCDICGKLLSEQPVPEKGHTSNNWVIDEEATCSVKGVRHCVCDVCGESITESIPVLSHAFGGWDVTKAPTCGVSGKKARTCSMCGHTETMMISALTHEYGEWEIVSGNKLIPPIVKEKTCAHCADVQSLTDWSYVWVTIVAGVVLLGVLIGVINYARAFKNR